MRTLTALTCLLLLGGCTPYAPTYKPTPVATATTEVGRLDEAIRGELGDLSREGERVESVTLKKDVVTVRWGIDDNLTDNLRIRGAMVDAVDILQAVEGSGVYYDTIRLQGTFPLVDKKGNESSGVVVDATYSMTELLDVNWDNFITDNVWDIADRYSLHPGFRP